MGGEEKVVEVAEDREAKVPQRVQERIVCDGHSSFPHLLFIFFRGRRSNYTLLCFSKLSKKQFLA